MSVFWYQRKKFKILAIKFQPLVIKRKPNRLVWEVAEGRALPVLLKKHLEGSCKSIYTQCQTPTDVKHQVKTTSDKSNFIPKIKSTRYYGKVGSLKELDQGSYKERMEFPQGKIPQIITIQVVVLITCAIFCQEKENLKICLSLSKHGRNKICMLYSCLSK